MADKNSAYEECYAFQEEIVCIGDMLAGQTVCDDPAEFPTWQSLAQRQARLLREYAQFLDDCAEGRVRGPIVFPEWEAGI